MHPFQRLYCHVFQGVFRLALPILPYRDPKLLTSVTDIPAALSAKGNPLYSVPVLWDARELEEIYRKAGGSRERA